MVLLVDDDPDFIESAKTSLCDQPFVLEATTPDQALALVKAIGFSVALVDLYLGPTDDGFALIQRIHKQHPKLPIVAISGVCSRAALESAKSFGATEVLHKPITPQWASVILRLRNESPTRETSTGLGSN